MEGEPRHTTIILYAECLLKFFFVVIALFSTWLNFLLPQSLMVLFLCIAELFNLSPVACISLDSGNMV